LFGRLKRACWRFGFFSPALGTTLRSRLVQYATHRPDKTAERTDPRSVRSDAVVAIVRLARPSTRRDERRFLFVLLTICAEAQGPFKN
jgi:hypothetical protein